MTSLAGDVALSPAAVLQSDWLPLQSQQFAPCPQPPPEQKRGERGKIKRERLKKKEREKERREREKEREEGREGGREGGRERDRQTDRQIEREIIQTQCSETKQKALFGQTKSLT